ncbi:MAG: asparagine synthase-related protein [Ginsengibacter sp.]
MLSFSISLKDLTYPCIATSKGWLFNESFIHPFIHPSLESFAITDGALYLFVVKERDSYGKTEIRDGTKLRNVFTSEIHKVRKDLIKWPLHYICVLIGPSSVSIDTGKWAVSPIYVLERNLQLIGHWDSIQLSKYLSPLKLDKVLVAHFLISFESPYAKNTLFANMYRLTERTVLHWCGKNTLQITYPPSLEQPFAKELKPGADVIGMFKEILQQSMSRWVRKDGKAISTELSSGLDSGIVSIIASSLTSKKLQTYGLLVMDEFRKAQIERRNEFITKFGFEDTAIQIKDLLPFSKNSYDRDNRKMLFWKECYYEAEDHLLSIAREKNDSLLFTGFGGDELFLPYWDEMSTKDQELCTINSHLPRQNVPSFINDDLYLAYSDSANSIKEAPKSLMAYSTAEAVAYSSPAYLSQNIWPVSPYATPELIMFCRSLPFSWRKNRRLQRQFLSEAGCSQQITHPEQPDNFRSVMTFALQKSASDINKLFQNSVLAELGYIDPKKFKDALNDHLKHQQNSKHSDVDFYTVIALEYAVSALDSART